jgi:hypothetical protein
MACLTPAMNRSARTVSHTSSTRQRVHRSDTSPTRQRVHRWSPRELTLWRFGLVCTIRTEDRPRVNALPAQDRRGPLPRRQGRQVRIAAGVPRARTRPRPGRIRATVYCQGSWEREPPNLELLCGMRRTQVDYPNFSGNEPANTVYAGPVAGVDPAAGTGRPRADEHRAAGRRLGAVRDPGRAGSDRAESGWRA